MRPAAPGPDGADQRRASGRERHTQKITVYLSAEELLDLERARLALLRYGAAADRGRIVREAIAVLLADLDARGKDSLLARRIASENQAIEKAAIENQARENENRANEQHGVSENGASTDGLPRIVLAGTCPSVPRYRVRSPSHGRFGCGRRVAGRNPAGTL